MTANASLVPSSPEAQRRCPICGGDTTAAFTSSRGHAVDRCDAADCGHLFVAEPEERQGVELEQWSAQQVAKSAESLKAEFSERNDRLIDYWQQRGFLPAGGKLLDFGSSVGHIVQSLSARRPDLQIRCVEASAPSRAYLASVGLDVVESIDQVDDRFDAALFVEVIEHVPDPVAVLTELGRRLKPGGRIFVTTPCGELRNGNHATRAYDQPEHIHFFTERSLQATCRAAGLQPIRFEFVPALYPLPTGVVGRAAAKAKHSALRLRASLEGHRHLVGFTSA